jgi:hypothetical protein
VPVVKRYLSKIARIIAQRMTIARGIQKGARTHHQDQLITPTSFKTIKTIPRTSHTPKPTTLVSIFFSPFSLDYNVIITHSVENVNSYYKIVTVPGRKKGGERPLGKGVPSLIISVIIFGCGRGSLGASCLFSNSSTSKIKESRKSKKSE